MITRCWRRIVAMVATTAVVSSGLTAGAPGAFATWSVSGNGGSAAAGTVMPAGSQPIVTVSGTSVTVTWAAASLAGGAHVSGYLVTRINAVNGTPATIAAACSGTVTTTTCTELAVPSGSWVYTETPVQDTWTGSTSPASAIAPVA